MKTKEVKSIQIQFSLEDRKIIDRLIRKKVGKVTILKILDEFSYVFDWYLGMFTLIKKMTSGMWVSLDYNEYHVLCNLISEAYNSDDEPDKEAIKAIGDAIDAQYNGRIA